MTIKANQKWIDKNGEIFTVWKVRKATTSEVRSSFRFRVPADEKVVEFVTEDELARWEKSRRISVDKMNEFAFMENYRSVP